MSEVKTIDMSNPNLLARTVLAESRGNYSHNDKWVVPVDLGRDVEWCREFLLKKGYTHRSVEKRIQPGKHDFAGEARRTERRRI